LKSATLIIANLMHIRKAESEVAVVLRRRVCASQVRRIGLEELGPIKASPWWELRVRVIFTR
jgi:hypothetical protein